MAFTIGFSVTWAKSRSTVPSLVTVKARIVPRLCPVAATTSKLVSTGAPSSRTVNRRWPGSMVQVHRLAKYSRTSTSVPAAIGRSHCSSGAAAASHRSVENTAAGVPAGTVASTPPTAG